MHCGLKRSFFFFVKIIDNTPSEIRLFLAQNTLWNLLVISRWFCRFLLGEAGALFHISK